MTRGPSSTKELCGTTSRRTLRTADCHPIRPMIRRSLGTTQPTLPPMAIRMWCLTIVVSLTCTHAWTGAEHLTRTTEVAFAASCELTSAQKCIGWEQMASFAFWAKRPKAVTMVTTTGLSTALPPACQKKCAFSCEIWAVPTSVL